MFRTILVAPAGLFMALLLFYALAMLSGIGARVEPKRESVPDLNFLMVRQDSQIELRKRELPPEPEDIVPQAQPEMPQMQKEVVAVNSPVPTVNVPDINVGVVLSLTPTLNNLVMPTPELILDTNPVALSQVPPSYPSRALRKKLEGRVMVEFLVTEAGTVKPGSVVVIESKPEGVFDSAVLRAIQRWRFKTRVVDGKAVPFKARQELEFKLER